MKSLNLLMFTIILVLRMSNGVCQANNWEKYFLSVKYERYADDYKYATGSSSVLAASNLGNMSIPDSQKSRLFFSVSLLLVTSSLIVENRDVRLGLASAGLASASIGLYLGIRKKK
jgi:hypothetical protein